MRELAIDARAASKNEMESAPTPPLLELEHVSVQRGDRLALNNLSLRIDAHERVAILGPNGCGKSTLVRTITRDFYPLHKPGTRMAIFGQERWHVFALRKLLGVVSASLVEANTRDICGLEAVLSGYFASVGVHDEFTQEMLDHSYAALEQLRVSYLAERPMTEMSSGEAWRVILARAIVHQPKALLFDEPSSHLDIAARAGLFNSLRELVHSGTGLVMVTHHFADIIPEIDRVILLRDGRVFADGPVASILTAQQLSAAFQAEIRVERAPDGHILAW